MEPFKFDLVTPEASFFSGTASMVEAPGTLGDFGVLIGHMPFVSTLRAGVITVHDAQDATTRIFVSGGIAEVNPTSCTILAERIIDLSKTSRSDAEARVTRAKHAVEHAFSHDDIVDASKELDIAEAVLLALAP